MIKGMVRYATASSNTGMSPSFSWAHINEWKLFPKN